MKRHLITSSAVLLSITLVSPAASAQPGAQYALLHPAPHGEHATLHINTRWKECSFQLDPSLTQKAWRQFTGEAGLVTYFRPLTDAKPLGKGHVELSALQWHTGIDDASEAWNNTFVHPDSTHWLFEGSGLSFPGLTFRVGVTNRLDVGAYFTKNPNANYGFYGAQVQYNVVNDVKRKWAASARTSFVSLYGPDDVTYSVYGLDLLASKEFRLKADWASVSPYVGVSSYLSHSHETSSVVDLADETVDGSQAMIGAQARISLISLGLEYSTARVRSRSFKVGIAF